MDAELTAEENRQIDSAWDDTSSPSTRPSTPPRKSVPPRPDTPSRPPPERWSKPLIDLQSSATPEAEIEVTEADLLVEPSARLAELTLPDQPATDAPDFDVTGSAHTLTAPRSDFSRDASRFGSILTGLALVVAVFGLAVWSLRSTPPVTVNALKAEAAANKGPELVALPARPAPPREAAPPPPAPSVTTVHVRTKPHDAVIFDERGRIGTGTAAVEVRPGQKRRLTVVRHLHDPERVTVDGSSETLVITLRERGP